MALEAQVLVNLQAVDITTAQPVQADFFVNGLRVSGPCEMYLGETVSVQARSRGYEKNFQHLVVTRDLAAAGIVFLMRPVPSGKQVVFQASPPLPGVRILLGSSAGQREIATDLTGRATAVLEPGPWTVQATADGYQPVQFSIQADKPAQYDIALVRTDAAKSEAGKAPFWMELPKPSVVQNPAEAIVPLEAHAPAYYTSAQCRMYIGSLFIDELQSIRWVLQANVIPVYGYASQFADAFLRGRSIVQGELVVNYVHPGYLLAAVEQQGKASLQASYLGDYFTDKNFVSAESKRSLRLRAKQPPVPANPLYLHKPFDVRLEIGDGPARSSRFLERCILISNEIIVAPDGNPIAEAYGFLARRAR